MPGDHVGHQQAHAEEDVLRLWGLGTAPKGPASDIDLEARKTEVEREITWVKEELRHREKEVVQGE